MGALARKVMETRAKLMKRARSPFPLWIALPLMILGAGFLVFFPIGLTWYDYGGFVAIAVAFGVWEKGTEIRRRRRAQERPPMNEAGTSEAENELRKTVGEKYSAIINELWTSAGLKCPICGAPFEEWGVADSIEVPLVHLTPRDVTEPYEGYVHLPVLCMTCGYTVFFRTALLDERIIEREGASKETPPAKGG